MFKNIKIKFKLVLIMSLLVTTVVAVIAIISYTLGKKSLEKARFSQLVSIRQVKKRAIEDYFKTLSNQTTTFANDKMIVSAMKDLSYAFHNVTNEGKTFNLEQIDQSLTQFYGTEFLTKFKSLAGHDASVTDYKSDWPQSIIFQNKYISANPNPIGSKFLLDQATTDTTRYDNLHGMYHPVIRDYLEKFGLYDVFLIDSKTGDVVYTVFKEVDYASNQLTGPQRNSNLAKCFNAANKTAKGAITLSDFEPYGPSYDAPASFIGTPIFDGDERIGVLVYQLPIDKINNLMTGNNEWVADGLGNSGETYIVAHDFKMRSVSRFLVEKPEDYYKMLAEIKVSDDIISKIKSTKSSILWQEIKTEATQASVNGSTDTKLINDYRGVSVLSAYSPLNIEGLKWNVISEMDEEEAFAEVRYLRNTSIIAGGILTVLAIIFALFIASTISKPIIKLSNDLDFISRGDLTINIDSNSKDEIGSANTALKNMVTKLKTIISTIVDTADNIAAASGEMNDSAQTMSQGATEQASSAEEVSSSMEEMAANIQQNTDNAKQTEKIAEKASGDIKEGKDSVNKTVDSMKIIASKISIIGEISRQTNLLALNAAVEAARAGEHGKGFAVVAAEVRKLAERSQTAASEIDQLSLSSVNIAISSGKLLEEIVPNIQKTSDLVQEIAAASIEQSTGAEQINEALQQLNQIVQQNAAAAEELSASAEELSAQSEQLKDLVGFFKIDNSNSQFEERKISTPKKTAIVSKSIRTKENKTIKSGGAHIDLGKSGHTDSLDKDYEKY